MCKGPKIGVIGSLMYLSYRNAEVFSVSARSRNKNPTESINTGVHRLHGSSPKKGTPVI